MEWVPCLGLDSKAAQARAEVAPGHQGGPRVPSCFITAVWFCLIPYQLHRQEVQHHCLQPTQEPDSSARFRSSCGAILTKPEVAFPQQDCERASLQ